MQIDLKVYKYLIIFLKVEENLKLKTSSYKKRFYSKMFEIKYQLEKNQTINRRKLKILKFSKDN